MKMYGSFLVTENKLHHYECNCNTRYTYIMRTVISNHKTRLRCSVCYTRNSRNVRNFLHFAVSCFRRDSLIMENTKQKFRFLYRVVGTRIVLVVWKKKFCHRRLQKKNLLASAHSFVEFKERTCYRAERASQCSTIMTATIKKRYYVK